MSSTQLVSKAILYPNSGLDSGLGKKKKKITMKLEGWIQERFLKS